jgi:putative permease
MMALVAAAFTVRWIVLALLIGIGLGVVLAPVMQFLHQRLKFPLPLAVTAILLLVLSAIGGVGFLIFHLVADQASSLIAKMPEFVQSVQRNYPWLSRQLQSLRGGQAVQGAGQTLLGALALSTSAVGGLVFVLATALYLVVDPGSYLAGLLSAFPARTRQTAQEVLAENARILRRWSISQLMAMTVMGVAVAIGLKIIGSNYWLLLAALTSILELFPFFGPVLSFISASLVTLGTQPDIIFWVMGFYLVMLALEGNLVIPLIMKGRIRLPPIQLLTLMLVLGEWFGILGFLSAAPVLAVLRQTYMMLYVPRMNRVPEERPMPQNAAQRSA